MSTIWEGGRKSFLSSGVRARGAFTWKIENNSVNALSGTTFQNNQSAHQLAALIVTYK